MRTMKINLGYAVRTHGYMCLKGQTGAQTRPLHQGP